ncbi:MAG: UDP-glucose 4-epimerase GalE [archaeon]
MKTILVTGGAGYIGSATVKVLLAKNYDVVVVDNLSHGKKSMVDKKAKFYRLDLAKDNLNEVFKDNKIDAVIHFAAYKSIEESMENPEKYEDNIIGTINLLDMMIKYKVKKIIYSSSAAVYGEHEGVADEKTETRPTNYYGVTKLECEDIIKDYSDEYNILYICLRYFNVAGDAGLNYVDKGAKNIFPIIMDVVFGKRKELEIFGNDYDTRDGTCIRDYIDINDLVEAHILALDVDYKGVINLGTSNGITVKELISFSEEVVGKKIKTINSPKRKGDVAVSIASNKKAKKILNWQPKKNVKEMIKSTFEAYKSFFS